MSDTDVVTGEEKETPSSIWLLFFLNRCVSRISTITKRSSAVRYSLNISQLFCMKRSNYYLSHTVWVGRCAANTLIHETIFFHLVRDSMPPYLVQRHLLAVLIISLKNRSILILITIKWESKPFNTDSVLLNTSTRGNSSAACVLEAR